ncbi:acyl-[acyl-carrier-protein]-phospholipid O-acyltransferase / long-chain-fatty-acid--[acyl-carrier-protein] ligase [Desulforhopalus singaporensis]|uniref:Acyl-[acyl-carrier-protein]-phospholipid O-acyltransferase / long-chain-fatty-acid--[acyl-carrier-protein] ligase n=1 Tax=Desulforhopalus singaporensis TaxID=91360 RepID=A0A1H0Q950_9BACT|nr:acyl-[acyl-carrier-protein]-phospholipid O-acyltransferase / long-chain-fatty-acid--[acyl-carrier-protein] ligase [Desulforhopalus singaporensis]
MLLHQRFIDIAKKFGSKKAIHDFSTNRELSYKKTLIASLILTRIIKRYHSGFIGVMIPTSAGCILAKLAILMAGRVPVMINYSTGAEQNARYAQQKCNFTTIITSKTLLEKIECPVVEGMVFLEDIMASVTGFDKIRALITASFPAGLLKKLVSCGDENNTAVILFTSGSEKDPKAVELSHKNILSNVSSVTPIFEFRSDDIFMCALPYFHVFGLTAVLWLPLYHGMTMLTYANPLDYQKICTIVREHQATFLIGTPAFFWGYLRKSSPGDFASLRIALTGADKCSDALREGFKTKHNITVLEGYGATECSPIISTNTPACNRPGSVGKPIPGTRVRIIHYETEDQCKPGVDGRIQVKGDSVMKGYYNDAEQTCKNVKDGWYDTGDMGNLDEDGYLWHVGRLKRFVKIGGEMVSLVRIEHVLEKLLPEDSFCCVVEVPDTIKGSRIIAVVTGEVDEQAILEQMAGQLPPIALPKAFLVWESLPKMGSGKIDFRTITEQIRQQLKPS